MGGLPRHLTIFGDILRRNEPPHATKFSNGRRTNNDAAYAAASALSRTGEMSLLTKRIGKRRTYRLLSKVSQ
jgi:hypothetical protein